MSINKKTILLVEDQVIIADAQAHAVRRFGYDVILAASGEQAVEIAVNNEAVSLVLMDIDLGQGIDGTEAARRILASRNLPIVFLTSHSEKEFVDKVKTITRYGYVIKNSGNFVLQTSIDMAYELFDANERIKKINKELLTVNVELRAAVEELEATNEEFEAANEELITTNLNLEEKDENLRRAYNDLKKSQEIAHIGNWTLDLLTNRFTSSNEALRIFGFNPGTEPLFHEVVECMLPEDRVRASAVLKNSMATGEPYRIDIRILKKDTGELRYITSIAEISMSESGSPKAVFGINMDITERRKAEAVTDEIIDKNPMSIQLVDTNGFTVRVNAAHTRLFGAIPPSGYSIFRDEQIAEQGLGEYMNRAREGEVVYFPDFFYNVHEINSDFPDIPVCLKMVIFPILGNRAKPEMYVLMHEDITERKRAESMLLESEERYRLVAGLTSDYFYKLNVDAAGNVKMVFVSETYQSVTGRTIDQVTNPDDWVNIFYPDDLPPVIDLMKKLIIEGGQGDIECRTYIADGAIRWVHVFARAEQDIELKRTVSIVGAVQDITERKLAEEKAYNLLNEKELLLHEVHHRIKNNMSTIISLLALQAFTLKDSAAVNALTDAENRVRSMIVLYDLLYRSADFKEASVKNYLDTLIGEISGLFSNRTSVKFETRSQDFNLSAKKLSPLGIIINEFVTNSMKHAFNKNENGLITINALLADNIVTVVMSDNGSGLPESTGLDNSSGFGFKLIKLLSDQISGSVKIERNNGTKFILEFKR